MRITCVIATRNRCAALLDALQSVVHQEGVDIDLVVFDDASEDNTCETVRKRFPNVTVIENRERKERLVLRNRGVDLAQDEYVLMLDDDCYLSDPRTVVDAVGYFSDPRVAVVCLPLIEPFRNKKNMRREPLARTGDSLGGFMAGASIFRRQAFLGVGGYREFLVHHHEEKDLAARLLNNGYRFVYAGARPIIHTVHPMRDREEQLRGYLRNMILIPFLNYPFPFSFLHMMSGTVQVLTVAFSNQAWPERLAGVVDGWRTSLSMLQHRSSIGYSAYRALRKLPKHRPEYWDKPIPSVPRKA